MVSWLPDNDSRCYKVVSFSLKISQNSIRFEFSFLISYEQSDLALRSISGSKTSIHGLCCMLKYVQEVDYVNFTAIIE